MSRLKQCLSMKFFRPLLRMSIANRRVGLVNMLVRKGTRRVEPSPEYGFSLRGRVINNILDEVGVPLGRGGNTMR